jgi:hypothetical protein
MSDLVFCFETGLVFNQCFNDAGANLPSIWQAVNKGYDVTSTLTSLNLTTSIIQKIFDCVCPDVFQKKLEQFDKLQCGSKFGVPSDAGSIVINGLCLYVYRVDSKKHYK